MVTYHRASKRTAFEGTHNALSTFVTLLERSYEMVTGYRQLLWHYVCKHFMMLTVSTKNLWNRHIVDSAQLIKSLPEGFNRFIDPPILY